MKPAFQKDSAFLADVEAWLDGPGQFRIWWLGQSGFLIAWNGHRLLLDPYLSDSLTRKYAQTGKPHVRITERVVDPALLTNIFAATSSHNHTDHLDAETLLPLRYANPALHLIIPEANRDFVAQRLICHPGWPHGLDDGTELTLGPFTFRGIAAAHDNLDRDSHGRHLYLGYLIRFGSFTVYHPGDCMLYEGLVEKLENQGIDLALLPINGSLPERHVAGNFWGREAAWLASQIGARLSIPCHYDLFEFNTVTTEEFEQAARELNIAFKVLRTGEGLTIASI